MTLCTTTVYKILSFFLILVSGVLGGLIPLKYKTSQKFVIYGNFFSGGVFLAVAFLHLLRESVDVEGDKPTSKILTFIPFYFVLLGILIPMFIEYFFGKNGLSNEFSRRGAIHTFILWLILGIHSIIEGIALGLKNTKESVITMFIAISSHKLFSAFSLGINLSKSNIPNLYYMVSILTFSIATPIGIVLGHFLNMAIQKVEGSPLNRYFDAFAGGTFIYIALVEILCEGHASAHHGDFHPHVYPKYHEFLKCALILLGIFLINAFLYYFDD